MRHPVEIRISSTRQSLQVTWDDGSATTLSAALLRERCQSAGAKRRRIDGEALALSSDLSIRNVEAIGSYAVNIEFSDGHARGIYPWPFLDTLAREAVEAIN